MSKDLVHSKRHGFLEMSRSIGMPILDESNDPVNIEGLDDLIRHIESINKTEIDRGCDLLKEGYYDFDSLPTLYPPGSYVLAKHAGGGGIDIFCQIVWNRFSQGKTIMGKPMKYFQLCARYIVPVGGGKATFAEVVEGIEMFEGRRSVTASATGVGIGLAFIPPLDGERSGLMERYGRRGEMYNRIVPRVDRNGEKMHAYMEYDKGCFFMKRGGSLTSGSSRSAGNASMALATGGRVIVDVDGASEYGHSFSVGRDDLITGISYKLKEYKLHLRLDEQSKEKQTGTIGKAGSNSSKAVSPGSMVLFDHVPNEYLSLVWPALLGFSFAAKSWGDIIIDGLMEISFNDDIFNRLVLPESRKRMVKALVKHSGHSSGFHDLVKGKGEGVVFLLYGPPGVGKTLTAEAVAEVLHRPLYSVSMGTLGTTADELERRLGEILQLSAKWDALILLDEADSFLETRSSNHLERNAMVSVMLRLVEYHQGILFLTSNRIDSLDPAFQTRITLALHYHALDEAGRAQVWENLLIKSGYGSQVDDGNIEVKELAKPLLNGREIKNALVLALALATDQGIALSQNMLLEAAQVVNDYKSTMNVDAMAKREDKKPRGRLWSWRR